MTSLDTDVCPFQELEQGSGSYYAFWNEDGNTWISVEGPGGLVWLELSTTPQKADIKWIDGNPPSRITPKEVTLPKAFWIVRNSTIGTLKEKAVGVAIWDGRDWETIPA